VRFGPRRLAVGWAAAESWTAMPLCLERGVLLEDGPRRSEIVVLLFHEPRVFDVSACVCVCVERPPPKLSVAPALSPLSKAAGYTRPHVIPQALCQIW
jgi:hypothetical protein